MNFAGSREAERRLKSYGEDRLTTKPQLNAALKNWGRGVADRISAISMEPRIRQVGRILDVGDGVATVSGLPQASLNELLLFPGNTLGLVLNLDVGRIGCVLLGDDRHLGAGDVVETTGKTASVPVGPGLLGRVVDSVGEPRDGSGSIDSEELREMEEEAPAILERAAVDTQLVTGLKAVDAMIPIGRGQRQLIVGDRATGKTAIAIDTIINQRENGVVCIYAAIGQKASTVKSVHKRLLDNRAMADTIILAADADDPPGLQFLAPYSATAMAEFFMRQGRDVLVVYDDLTRHARAYRQLSLLLRRPPGREAYPGDIFFIHSRLLERATHLSEASGGGSLTALPIVETQANNLSAYIPTNLISITDGQILLDPDLFAKGIKPAIHIGKSVSRVGGKAQLPGLRAVAKSLRLRYTQFEELEFFTRFGATVEKETQRKIDRGQRIRELLKQQRLQPLPAEELAVLLLAVERNLLDAVPLDGAQDFSRKICTKAREEFGELLDKIHQGEELEEEEWDRIAGLIEEEAPEEEQEKEASDRNDEAEAEAQREKEGEEEVEEKDNRAEDEKAKKS